MAFAPPHRDTTSFHSRSVGRRLWEPTTMIRTTYFRFLTFSIGRFNRREDSSSKIHEGCQRINYHDVVRGELSNEDFPSWLVPPFEVLRRFFFVAVGLPVNLPCSSAIHYSDNMYQTKTKTCIFGGRFPELSRGKLLLYQRTSSRYTATTELNLPTRTSDNCM